MLPAESSSSVAGSLIETQDVDEARRLVRLVYGDRASFEPVRVQKTRFQWRLRHAVRGPVSLVRGHIAADVVLSTEGLGSGFILGTLRSGACEVRHAGRSFSASEGKTAFLVSPDLPGTISVSTREQGLNLRIERGALDAYFSALTGAPLLRSVRFAPEVDLTRGPGGGVGKLFNLLAEAIMTDEEPLGSAMIVAHLREALFHALFTGLEHDQMHLLQREPRRTNEPLVRRAEEYLTANAHEAVSLADLAVQLGVGLRALAPGGRRHFPLAVGAPRSDFEKIAGGYPVFRIEPA